MTILCSFVCQFSVIFSFIAGGTLTFNIPDIYPESKEEVVKGRFQAYVDDGQWKKWEVQRAPYFKDEDCNIFNIFI